MTPHAARPRHGAPLAWLAALFLVIAALLPPVTGPATGADAPGHAMEMGADMPHGMDCCPEGGHAAGAVCAACLLAVASAPVVTPVLAVEGLRLGLPPAPPVARILSEVPHGPPRLA